jgi:phage shock protein A
MSYTEDLLNLRQAEVTALRIENDGLRKKIEQLNIEIINRDFKIQQLEDAINK